MNIALPALVIILGIMPGIAFFYGYFGGRFEKRNAGVSGMEEVALYIAFAIPIDAVAAASGHWFGRDLDFELITRLLYGVGDSAIPLVAGQIRDRFFSSAAVYIAVVGTSFVVGSACRRIVWAFRLDVHVPALALRHDWFYILQGRLKGNPRTVLPAVNILSTHPDGSRMYKGIVVDFEIAANTGAIQFLILTATYRGKGRGKRFKWIPVPSDRFVIMGSTIHSVNVSYVAVELQKPSRHWLNTWIRRFLRQEP